MTGQTEKAPEQRAERGEKALKAAECCGLALMQRLQGNNAAAIAQYEAALTADPVCEQAYLGAMEAMVADGHILHALDCCARGMQAIPQSLVLKRKFAFMFKSTGFRKFHPQLRALLLDCLTTEGVDMAGNGPSWLRLLKIDPAFKPVRRAMKAQRYGGFVRAMKRLESRQALRDPFLLAGLKRMLVPDIGFERYLTHLRRFLLESYSKDRMFLDREKLEPLVEALALYCLFTDHVFGCAPEEKALIETLRRRVETEPSADPVDAALLACYIPLCALANAEAVNRGLSGSHLKDVSRLQIADPLERRQIAASITALTPIDDAISQRVREQYEEFPYPVWTTYTSEIYHKEIEGKLTGAKARILVAGCGTGREAVELAAAFPDATVLGVDLSFASLSYAIQMARRHGIRNVEFRQADILRLEELQEHFDFIASSGVLHHMQDPFQGWSVLTGLLKPGGLMRVGLYSATARRSVTEARAVIRKHGYGSDAGEIRRFREDAKKILARRVWQSVTRFYDYYALPACRDLLFHVQEQYFDLPAIKGHLNRLGLEFLSFYLPVPIGQYLAVCPEDLAGTDLDGWARFERQNPDTFTNMYKFLCRKKG